MEITKVSMFTGKSHTFEIDVTEEQLAAWRGGLLIQVAMPNLAPETREFLMTGVTPDEWANAFKEES